MNDRIKILPVVASLILIWQPTLPAQESVAPRPGLEAVAGRLGAFIEHEMKAQDLPAVSIAVVEGRRIVWARGFGRAKDRADAAANAETVYRVGSVSKLFTDLAVMQLVEAGEFDLDAPVTRYLPDFAPKNPFKIPITLRHLMSHRSGLVRESPVGHYFDPKSPSLADTVASLNTTELVYPPGERTKYSNAGVAVVGRVVEKVKGEPFATRLKRAILAPMKLDSTDFDASPAIQARLADGRMWTYDGRSFPAPTFLLGTGPAGNLYSTVNDLGRFLIALLDVDGGRGVVKPETLRAMWTPQFAENGATTGFGLGFHLTIFDGHRRVGHNGAIYGFAADVSLLPDDQLGVAVVITKDCANTTASRIGDAALRLMLAAAKGDPLPAIPTTEPLTTGRAHELDGRYEAKDASVDLTARGDRLFLTRSNGGFRQELRKQGDTIVTDDPLGFGVRLGTGADSVTLGKAEFKRAQHPKPGPPPSRWEGLIGEYGWDHNTLFILESGGRLFALIEWFFLDPLEEVSPDVFRFPNGGLYVGESLRFTRDATGRALEVNAANVVFQRRKIGGDDGTTFRITPLRPVADLRIEAMKATPPVEPEERRPPDLVDLMALDSTIKFDLRYATANNFLGTPFYPSSRAFMQRPAAEELVKVHRRLKERGLGLLIHDAYRPWYVTRMFWDATPESGRGFVADPSKGSKHNRGCAVDLTLYDLASGRPIEMVGAYDEFSARSSPDYPGGTSLQRWHRDLLRREMEAGGFAVNEVEWWHFDYRDWPSYPLLNKSFEDLTR